MTFSFILIIKWFEMSKRKRISAELAIDNILNFVYENSGDEKSDLDDLYGDEDFNVSTEVETRETEPLQNIDDLVNEWSNDSSNEEEVNNLLNRRTHRKKAYLSRNVNSIDSALDETNYHMIELPEERKRITGYLPSKHSNQKKKKSDKIEIHFTNHPLQNVGRQGSQNVIKNKPGVHGNARNVATERQAFEVFFTEEMMGNVVTFTNKKK